MATIYSDTGLANDITARAVMIKSGLDEIIKKEAVTTAMAASPEMQAAFGESKTAKLATMVTSGLGDYDKVQGYPIGNVQVTWESYELAYDRALEIDVDRLDTIQTGGLATAAQAAAQTMRQHIIPEIDATRISRAVSKTKTADATHVVEEAAPTAANLITKIGAGLDVIFEERGVDSGATIYMNSSMKPILRASTEYTKTKPISGAPDIDLSTNSIDGNQIVWVPNARMKTAYTYGNPSSTTKGGIAAASGATDINFLIVAPGCAQGVTVIANTKIIPADQNQRKDADAYQYRIYHDVIVETNSGASGIYAQVTKGTTTGSG